jgi:XTP/dITP diphosphohydrolase
MKLKNNTILFATKNPGKLAEFKEVIDKFGSFYRVISFKDLAYDIPDCIESGSTFEENAILKVRNTKKHLKDSDKKLIIIADDSGMQIDYLKGEPGVFTRRWNGHEMSDKEIISYCLEELKDTESRKASYTSCFAIYVPGNTIKIISGNSRGYILRESRSDSMLTGMPFRSLFYVPELKMMFHEVRGLPAPDIKGYSLGHEEAIRKIIQYLRKKSKS